MTNLLYLLVGTEAATSVWGLLLLISIGLLAITKGGDLFTDSSVEIARMTNIPPVIVGATIVSTATSFPEFMVSITGTLSGTTEFAVGNAIGSCLCNIGLIIGVCAIVRGVIARREGKPGGIAADRDMLRGPGMFMLGSCVAVCVFSLVAPGGAQIDGQFTQFGISKWQGAILLTGAFWYIGYSVRAARRARYETSLEEGDAEPPKISGRRIASATILFVAATAMVVVGSRLLVCNGEEIAIRMGVPRLVLGLTLFAIGTSLPEFTISLIAVLKGHEALGIGNIIGSNVLNITWVLASCAMITPLPISLQTVLIDLPVTLLLTVLLLVLPWKSERISTRTGWLLLSIYLVHTLGITIAGVM